MNGIMALTSPPPSPHRAAAAALEHEYGSVSTTKRRRNNNNPRSSLNNHLHSDDYHQHLLRLNLDIMSVTVCPENEVTAILLEVPSTSRIDHTLLTNIGNSFDDEVLNWYIQIQSPNRWQIVITIDNKLSGLSSKRRRHATSKQPFFTTRKTRSGALLQNWSINMAASGDNNPNGGRNSGSVFKRLMNWFWSPFEAVGPVSTSQESKQKLLTDPRTVCREKKKTLVVASGANQHQDNQEKSHGAHESLNGIDKKTFVVLDNASRDSLRHQHLIQSAVSFARKMYPCEIQWGGSESGTRSMSTRHQQGPEETPSAYRRGQNEFELVFPLLVQQQRPASCLLSKDARRHHQQAHAVGPRRLQQQTCIKINPQRLLEHSHRQQTTWWFELNSNRLTFHVCVHGAQRQTSHKKHGLQSASQTSKFGVLPGE